MYHGNTISELRRQINILRGPGAPRLHDDPQTQTATLTNLVRATEKTYDAEKLIKKTEKNKRLDELIEKLFCQNEENRTLLNENYERKREIDTASFAS